MYKRQIFTAFIFILITGLFFYVGIDEVHTGNIELIKSTTSDTVYYLDDRQVRHPFPNRATYESWYGDDFSRVITVSDEWLVTLPLGHNVTIRPGVWLVKVPSRSEVYAVEPGGVLRHIDDVAIAESLFGDNWQSRLFDIPEVFFDNYIIGEPITKTRVIPDGILYKISGEDIFYWKNNGMLKRFSSEDAVIANRLDPAKAIVNSQLFYTRDAIITGFDQNVFNPVMPRNLETQDCQSEDLKAAFIFVYRGDFDDGELLKIQRYQKELPSFWNDITSEFSSFDTSFPVYLLPDDGELTIRNKYNRFDLKDEIVSVFYDEANDVFDFLIIFTNFPVGEENEATYLPVTNYIDGIGKLVLNRSEIYGSGGKLKGVITMGDIGDFSIDTKRLEESALNILSHEILHHWSGALYFIDETGKLNSGLLSEDLVHWSPWVDFSSPLGGLGWHERSDGKLEIDTTLSSSLKRQLSILDLYAMGFLPAQVVAPVRYIETDMLEPPSTVLDEGTFREVTIEQIIEANGVRRCRQF